MSNAAQQPITGTTLTADIIDMIEFDEYDRGTGSLHTAISEAEKAENQARYIAEWVLAGAAENEGEVVDDMYNCLDITIAPFCDDDESPLDLELDVIKELDNLVASAEPEAVEMRKKAQEIAKDAIAEAKQVAQNTQDDNTNGEAAAYLDLDGLLRALVTQELHSMAQEGQDDGRTFWGDCSDGSTYWVIVEQPVGNHHYR